MKHLAKYLKNRIWFIAAAVLLVLLAVQGCGKLYEPAMALEQLARCGEQEHLHTEECYMDELLTCKSKAHTHSENCYIFRVDENDLNAILTDMGEKKIYSLEEYMAYTLSSVYGEGTSLDDMLRYVSIDELNAVLAASGDSKLRFNAAADLPATYTVGGTPQISGDYVNFYILLDGEITFLGYSALTLNPVATYGYIVDADVALKNYTDAGLIVKTEINYDAIYATYYLRFTTNIPQSAASFDQISGVSTTNLTFNGSMNSPLKPPAYAILTTRTGGNWISGYTYAPVPFYTVTLDYGGDTNEVQYVQEGQNSTLKPNTDNYTWYASNDPNATPLKNNEIEKALKNISSTTTLYARGSSHTVTYDYNYDGKGTYFTQNNINNNATIKAPADPTRTGYTFGGWYTEATCTNEYNFSSPVTSSFTLYAKWTPDIHKITWLNWDGKELKTDEVAYDSMPSYTGATPTKPSDKDGISYVFTGWSPTVVKVSGDATYTAQFSEKTATYTVTFHSNGGSAVAPEEVEHGKTVSVPANPTRAGHTFIGWYLGKELFNFSTPITRDITLSAGWEVNKYTVTFKDGSTGDTVETRTVSYGDKITLPEVVNGIYWQTNGEFYEAGAEFTVSGNTTFTSIDKVVATYIYKDGTTTKTTVDPNTTITLPAVKNSGHVWMVQGGNGTPYSAGATYTLSENTIFVESSTLKVTYTTAYSSVFGDTSFIIAEANSHSVSAISETYVVASDNQVARFTGWLTESGTLLVPGTRLVWDELSSYDTNTDGTVALTAQWEKNGNSTIQFFVNMSSDTGASGEYGNADWTGTVYRAYAGNMPAKNGNYGSYGSYVNYINANWMISRDDAATDHCGNNTLTPYQRDQLVDALVGERDEGVWISNIPSDAEMFDILRTMYPNRTFTVNGITYTMDQLNPSEFTIRWHHFKYIEDPGWHLDGLLVRKKGQIYVDKIFGGIQNAIEQAIDGFYILAENGYLDANGDFVPYESGEKAYNAHVLVLDPETETALRNTYPKATFQIRNYEGPVSDGLMEEWLITGVELGEYWRFTEHAIHPTYSDPSGGEKRYSWYAEYTITDTDGEHSAIAEFGSTAQVIGKTYALDEDPDQGLSIKFTNYYYSSDSVLVRKIDSDTGEPLGGASFELWQPNKDGEDVKLRFSDDGNGVYTLSDSGEKTTITTNAQGFSVITITGFSFDAGPLTVKEVVAPDGYDLVNPVTVHYLKDANGNLTKDVGITEIKNIDPARYDEFAEYNYDENTQGGVIIVKDHTSHEATVTAKKIWENPDYTADSVTVVLLATVNDVTQNAGALFPNLTGHQVVLNEANNWTYTWTGLPAYANGEIVQWSIKETKVGSDPTLSDGVSFASWIASYSPVSSWDSDGNGITDSWYATVTNSQKRPMVNVYKLDSKTNTLLEGATFTLEKVQWKNGQWQQVAGSFVLTQTTDANGWLLFDNLTPSSTGSATFYRLTETSPPLGYTKLADSVVFTIDGFGNIYEAKDGLAGTTSLDTEYVDFYSRYYITVRNEAMPAFPNTGGEGTDVYIRLGALLMLAAAAAVIYKTKRRKEGDASAV